MQALLFLWWDGEEWKGDGESLYFFGKKEIV
jgi:hypothetical protein